VISIFGCVAPGALHHWRSLLGILRGYGLVVMGIAGVAAAIFAIAIIPIMPVISGRPSFAELDPIGSVLGVVGLVLVEPRSWGRIKSGLRLCCPDRWYWVSS